jgi:GNAT superfamily N-acetyltransferase
MTDVYVLPEHQGKGLGKWLVGCVRETLDAWPALRGTLLYASEGREAPFYRALMGVEAWVQGEDGMLIMTRRYAGSGMYHG